MKEQKKFSIKDRFKSFSYAFNGLKLLLKEEHNSRIHLAITITVLILSILLKISTTEWLFVILLIGFVFVTEILNSAIENLADFVSPEKNNLIKKVKDLAAAGVLLSAVTALIVGIVIFLPKIIEKF